MSDSPNILVVGAGAIGAYYGAMLAKQGAQVSVVCRSDFDVVSRDGYAIKSPMGDQVFRPARVLRDAADYDAPPAYLLLTLKVLDGVDRVGPIRAAVGPHTVIVLIENGIDIETEIARAFPDNELISVLAYVGIARAYKTSMAQDYESGRPMEVEAILGNVVRAARTLVVATPRLDSLYALMKMVQARQARKE